MDQKRPKKAQKDSSRREKKVEAQIFYKTNSIVYSELLKSFLDSALLKTQPDRTKTGSKYPFIKNHFYKMIGSLKKIILPHLASHLPTTGPKMALNHQKVL